MAVRINGLTAQVHKANAQVKMTAAQPNTPDLRAELRGAEHDIACLDVAVGAGGGDGLGDNDTVGCR